MIRSARRLFLAATAAALLAAPAARADEKILGTVSRIQLVGAGAVATLVAEDGKTVELHVDDAITLEKLKDRRIGLGDQVKAKYEVKGGKNRATYFKKPGGC